MPPTIVPTRNRLVSTSPSSAARGGNAYRVAARSYGSITIGATSTTRYHTPHAQPQSLGRARPPSCPEGCHEWRVTQRQGASSSEASSHPPRDGRSGGRGGAPPGADY